jgi:prophage antirepressor-like protein
VSANLAVLTICGVRGYEQDGVAYLHIEDVARGLGFTTTTEKGGVEYTNVRWSRVEECLQDLNFLPQVAENGNPHDYYIPENIFYRLCMKAKNSVAEAFQAKVADEIIPSIRKTGSYTALPKTYLEALKALVASEEAREAAQKALVAEKEAHEKDNADFQAGLEILNRKKAEISSRREAEALGRLSNIAMREKIVAYTETTCKKQLGILRDGRYRAEQLLNTKWMRNCFRSDAYKDLKRWLTNMASRRVTARLISELNVSSENASTLRECYMRAKMYGMDFDDLCEECGFRDVRMAYRVLSSCVSVVDRYECEKSNGESKICPVCGYTPELWGEVLCAMIESSKLDKWLRDDTTVEEFAWWVAQKSGENYGLPV